MLLLSLCVFGRVSANMSKQRLTILFPSVTCSPVTLASADRRQVWQHVGERERTLLDAVVHVRSEMSHGATRCSHILLHLVAMVLPPAVWQVVV